MRVGDRVKVSFRLSTQTIHRMGTVFRDSADMVQVLIDNQAMPQWFEAHRVTRLLDSPADITSLEIAMALDGNTAPAANADEWETQMLYLLAEFDRLKGVR